MDQIMEIQQRLSKENITCVIQKGETIKEFSDTGIKPLLKCIKEDKQFMKGADIADRVIGKAAAMLMVYGGVSKIYTPLIREHALTVLKANKIKVEYEVLVPYIINRTKTDMCPMEKLCMELESPEEAYEALCKKVEQK